MVNVSQHERELVTMDRWHVEREGFLRKSPGMLTKESIWPQNRLSLLVWTLRVSSHSEKKNDFFPLGMQPESSGYQRQRLLFLGRPDTWVKDHSVNFWWVSGGWAFILACDLHYSLQATISYVWQRLCCRNSQLATLHEAITFLSVYNLLDKIKTQINAYAGDWNPEVVFVRDHFPGRC